MAIDAKILETKGGVVEVGTFSVNPASIAAGANGTTDVTIAGLATTDVVVVNPPSTLTDGLVFCGANVTAANTLTVSLLNTTDEAVDGAALTWSYIALRKAV